MFKGYYDNDSSEHPVIMNKGCKFMQDEKNFLLEIILKESILR